MEDCRPFISIDGCFVKLTNGAQVLAASRRDGNNNMYPIAFAVVGKEDTESWTWFLERLQMAIGNGEGHGGWTIMSDRQKGLMKAVHTVFPGCEHRYCKRPLLQNMGATGYRGEKYKSFVDAVVYAYTEFDYNIAMNALKKYNEKAWEWLNKIGKEHFSRHAFSPRSKTDLVVNNLSEVFNNYIIEYRDKPIITMSDCIRPRLMTRYCSKREGSEQAMWEITSVVAGKLEMEKNYSKYSRPFQAGVHIWQVHVSDRCYEVNLEHRRCDCNMWQITRIPCSHAISAIYKAKRVPEDYVDAYFKKAAYQRAYAQMIYPVLGEHHWVRTESEDIDPPKFHKHVGRPPKNRKGEWMRHQGPLDELE